MQQQRSHAAADSHWSSLACQKCTVTAMTCVHLSKNKEGFPDLQEFVSLFKGPPLKLICTILFIKWRGGGFFKVVNIGTNTKWKMQENFLGQFFPYLGSVAGPVI